MFEYDPVLYSRILTGLTLFVHILFASIGVGVPIMIALAEWMGIKRKDPHYTLLARRWARGFVITVAVGVVTGTAIGLQLSLLWPSFMRFAGQAIALPLFMETFAFFVEAIFLGIYLYTWDRFKNQMLHLLFLIPVAIGASFSAFFITTLNAFMNTPQGFKLVDGVIQDFQPLVAMFNPAVPTKVSHVITSSYTASACVLAALAAYTMLRRKKTGHHIYYKKSLRLTVVAFFVFTSATALIGDFSGKFLAQYQPEKLAAAEWHFETKSQAPLVFGGILDENHNVKYGVTIPYALSILAYNDPGAEVVGLNDIPEDERPPLIIHYFFDSKVAIGMIILLIGFLYFVRYRWFKKNPYPKWLLWAIVATGPLSLLAIEFGWFLAELGRQPWIIRGYMKVSEAATTSNQVDIMLVLFCFLYLLLCLTVVRVLYKLFKNQDALEELRQMGMEGEEKK